ncbi:MAG: sodium:solute symporter family protein [Planctomycetes bacterium]|nr:sodium:solute symporter family protein [Planctomycetota bacterium]
MLGLHAADIAMLAIYFASITCIGVWSARRVKKTSDFVMPRRFGKTLMVFFSFGTGTHSDQAVGVAAKSYTSGVSGIWYQWLWLFASPFYWLIAPAMRRFRALTTADVFEARYDRSVAILYAAVALAAYTVNIGVMLKGSSAVVEACTGDLIGAEIAIAIMTVLFVVYGMAGGLGAAVITDFIQGVLTIAFSFILLPYILVEVGGMAGLRETLPDLAPDRNYLSLVAPEEISVFYVFMLCLNALVNIVTQPHVMGNCAAGRTELDGQVGFMGGNLIKRVCTIAWCLIGVAGIAHFAGSEIHEDQVFGEVARQILPAILPGMLGLFLAGLLASVMSSCDAFMVASAGLFTENIYKKWRRPGLSDRHYLWVARISSLGVVAAGVICAFSLEGVVAGLESFWKVNSLLAIAFWMGLFWRRATPTGAWASTLALGLVWWITNQSFGVELARRLPGAEALGFVVEKGSKAEVFLPWQIAFFLAAGLVAGVAVSLFTRRVDSEKLERFYALVRTPVKEGEVVDEPCTLPADAEVPPRRLLFPAWTGLEILVPSRRSIIGFLVGWAAVALLVGVFVWIVKAG